MTPLVYLMTMPSYAQRPAHQVQNQFITTTLSYASYWL
jgi:hypothetical protein